MMIAGAPEWCVRILADLQGFQETGGSRRKQAADALEWHIEMVN
jgi:hypothetical protein